MYVSPVAALLAVFVSQPCGRVIAFNAPEPSRPQLEKQPMSCGHRGRVVSSSTGEMVLEPASLDYRMLMKL